MSEAMTAETKATGSQRLQPRWAALVAAALVIVVLAVFRDTTLDMYGIWMRSGTFTHCLLVLPICIWLLWERRASLQCVGFVPAALPLLFLAGAGVLWVMGEAVSAAVVSHFAVAFMLIAVVWLIWGHRAAWLAVFPLSFVLFAVPFGEFLTPTLMQYTAKFTVALVRASGVPVYQEGMNFVIPSGRWSVVEACSGIRYLIASVMVGVLFAYLNYRSAKRRVYFVLASLVVPVLANWLRAYLIVMLGHLSGNTLAVGADHLVYGWVFFGLVIGLLFWVGTIWREDEAALPAATQLAAPAGSGVNARTIVLVVLALLILAMPVPVFNWLTRLPTAADYKVPAIQPATGWVAAASGNPGWQAVYKGEKASSLQVFKRGEQRVIVQIAYFSSQSPGHELVQFDNHLVDSDDRLWGVVAEARAELSAQDGQSVQFQQAEIGGDGGRLLALRTYWLGEASTTSSDRAAKLDLLKARLQRQPDDSAGVVIWTPMDSTPAVAQKTLEAFVRDNWSAVQTALQHTARH
ncbi:exosortase A [Uliginosibacterium sp. H3]|uniref:Exosortase A n=1 Tax=Uliginosibacterium silvisoli TaxID=3114758 RepID=A0ABU6K712_9RHOO|nr:exosortase A [Uliginosibacterium sp. H3]